MIKQIDKAQIEECVGVIQRSFETVAKEFNITRKNAPRYVAFATTKKKLEEQLNNGRLMFAYFKDDNIIGYYSLNTYNEECEICNLCVLPEYRQAGIGKALLTHAFDTAKQLGYKAISISITEENTSLKRWYESYGFRTTHIEKYNFFPFTCGYMKKKIKEG